MTEGTGTGFYRERYFSIIPRDSLIKIVSQIQADSGHCPEFEILEFFTVEFWYLLKILTSKFLNTLDKVIINLFLF
jgi:hypothetical protein